MAFTAKLGSPASMLGNIELGIAEPITTSTVLPQINLGPRMRGAPWSRRVKPLEGFGLNQAPQPPRQVGQTNPPSPITTGPPMRGAPWIRRLPIVQYGVPRSGSAPVPNLGPNKGFVPRVPDIEGQAGKDRLRRHTEIVQQIFNSLIAQGELIQTGPATWELSLGGGGGGVVSFNGRTGAVLLLLADVISALGFTPVPSTRTVNAGGGLAGGGSLSSDITLALMPQGSGGVYTNATITVDGYGRVVAASTGSGGAVTSPDGSLTVTGGTVVVINLGHRNVWTVPQEFQANIAANQGGVTPGFVIGDLTGSPIGNASVDIQSTRSSPTQAATGANATAVGQNVTASGIQSVAIGFGSSSSYYQATAIGPGSSASGTHGVSIGVAASNSGNDSVCIGTGATTTGGNSFVIGSSTVSGDYTISIGPGTTVSANNATGIGRGVTASALYALAIGSGVPGGIPPPAAAGLQAVALGAGTTASADYSLAVGTTANASFPKTTAVGFGSAAGGNYATSVGSGASASGYYSTAVGNTAGASGIGATAVGFGVTNSTNYSAEIGYTSSKINVTSGGARATVPWLYTTGAVMADTSRNLYLPAGLSDSTPGFGSTGNVLANSAGLPVWQDPIAAKIGAIRASADLTGQSAGGTICTFTDSGSGGTYRCGAYITITAITAGTVVLQVTWTDETSTVRTISIAPQGLTSANLTATGVFLFPELAIRVAASTAITVKTTFAGVSVAFDTGAQIEQLR